MIKSIQKHYKSVLLIALIASLGGLFLFRKVIQQDSRKVQPESVPAENFVLVDNHGVFHELFNYSDQNAIVLISQANGCLINQQTAAYLNSLQEHFENERVTILMINANPLDNKDSIVKEAQEYKMGIPILVDSSQMISAGLKIQQAGEAFVINPLDWTVVYRGAIKDKKKHYLRDAIHALIKEEDIAFRKTDIDGCKINMEMTNAQNNITYVNDVSPILINYCLSCHNEGRDDNWALSDYDTVVSYGSLIREQIRTKRMPPWEGDDSLPPEDIRTLILWVEQNMTRGEGEDPLKNSLIYPNQGGENAY